MTWHFTAEFCPQGDIGRFSDARIEAGVHWTGKRGRLVQALTDARWLDQDSECRLLVHDWHEHADGVVKKRLERAGLSFLTPAPKLTEQRQPTADNGWLARAQSHPVPSNPGQALPDQTMIDTPTLSEKSSESREGQNALCVSPGSEELWEALSPWKLAFPEGPDVAAIQAITTELSGTPVKAFVTHLEVIQSAPKYRKFRPGAGPPSEPEAPGWFKSAARNFAKDYGSGISNGLPQEQLDRLSESF